MSRNAEHESGKFTGLTDVAQCAASLPVEVNRVSKSTRELQQISDVEDEFQDMKCASLDRDPSSRNSVVPISYSEMSEKLPRVNQEPGPNNGENRPDFPEAGYRKHEANSGIPKPSKYGLNSYFSSVISKNPSAGNKQRRAGTEGGGVDEKQTEEDDHLTEQQQNSVRVNVQSNINIFYQFAAKDHRSFIHLEQANARGH